MKFLCLYILVCTWWATYAATYNWYILCRKNIFITLGCWLLNAILCPIAILVAVYKIIIRDRKE